MLDYWYQFTGASGMLDFVSWHPYTIWYDYSYKGGELGPGDPAPFPEFSYSGDGTGADYNDGTGSDFHQASYECPSSVTSEYSLDFYNGSTAEYRRCGDAILSQISKLQTMANTHHLSGKQMWATEGGFSDLFAIQGTVTGMSGLTARDFLRTNWLARWLICSRRMACRDRTHTPLTRMARTRAMACISTSRPAAGCRSTSPSRF